MAAGANTLIDLIAALQLRVIEVAEGAFEAPVLRLDLRLLVPGLGRRAARLLRRDRARVQRRGEPNERDRAQRCEKHADHIAPSVCT